MSSVQSWQYADDEAVLGARLGAIERAIAVLQNSPRRPGVANWSIDQDPSTGAFIAVNDKTRMQYPILLGPGTPIPS